MYIQHTWCIAISRATIIATFLSFRAVRITLTLDYTNRYRIWRRLGAVARFLWLNCKKIGKIEDKKYVYTPYTSRCILPLSKCRVKIRKMSFHHPRVSGVLVLKVCRSGCWIQLSCILTCVVVSLSRSLPFNLPCYTLFYLVFPNDMSHES